MKNNWINEREYLLEKMFELVRIPKELFGEGEKTYSQIENEKLWKKLRREK